MVPLLYISVASEDRIAVFRRSLDNCSLEALPHLDCHIEGSPGAMCHMRLPSGHQRMYCVCSRGGVPGVATVAVDEQTGGLVELGWAPAAFDDFASYLSTDRSGSFLFSAYYSAGGCAVHRILADGTIGGLNDRHITAPQAHAIDIDATNSLVLVPHVYVWLSSRTPFDTQLPNYMVTSASQSSERCVPQG